MKSVLISGTRLLVQLYLLLSVSVLIAQQKEVITGVVKNVDGPIQGAVITIKNTFNETITNQKGEFSITATQDDTVLEVA